MAADGSRDQNSRALRITTGPFLFCARDCRPSGDEVNQEVAGYAERS